MLRVLTLSTLFPNAVRPTLGPFVERQTIGLAARAGVAVEVVAPVGLPPWPLSHHPHYAPLRALPEREVWKGLAVHRPRYRVWPLVGAAATPAAIARALLPRLKDIRERFPFDVIDAEFFWPDGPAAMQLARALGVPFSIKARGSDIHYWAMRPRTRAQVIAAGHAADGLLAVSAALRDDMAALGLPADSIRVHHTGIDLERFRPVDRKPAKAALGMSGPLLIAVGTLMERKGQRLAVEALTELTEASLILVGGGPDRPVLERLARKLGVQERVRILGVRPHEDLPALLAAADVAVQPSASEGLANVWVEALACGTPVVTCAVGGARNVIDRPAAGRLVARNAQAIVAAVADLLASPPPQAEVRGAAEKFSWDRNAEELEAHLRALVAARQPMKGRVTGP
ncbi:glycosyltransferase [Sphingosinicella terrae]|uniref:glycosyltransferase n=1 Tax=Sphingosinicella terrae TaxID=2172047 RepID=UPI000E0CC81F|nr:glycosyltransferase [Sphingosinicella terrae]